ncbi:LAGLIDADG family homing endonuclease [Candidatus Nomurabacteria bacterium]|nr:LAGLIDADG family homing endonuclease [Candidatus Nomurabacteria bacterium]
MQKEGLAYIIGVAAGDGNLSNPNGRAVRLRITCDNRYPVLMKKIQKEIEKILPQNKVSFIFRKDGCTDISCYSNKWPYLLGWNVGTKYDQQILLPQWIFQKKTFISQCLKGLIETDGTIYVDRGYTMVSFTSTLRGLTYQVQTMLQILGFSEKVYSMKPKGNRKIRYNIRVAKDADILISMIKLNKR